MNWLMDPDMIYPPIVVEFVYIQRIINLLFDDKRVLDGKNSVNNKKYEPGPWASVFISPVSSFVWVEEDTIITFKGYKLMLTPAEDKEYPAVYINLRTNFRSRNSEHSDRGINIILEFLSAYSWQSGQFFEIKGTGGGSFPFKQRGFDKYIPTSKIHFFDEVPEINDKQALLALALRREAESQQHPAFRFLSFYRIINLVFSNPIKQKEWINNSLSSLDSHAQEKITELRKTETDIANYLYVSCRCAVAHANTDNITINPDDYSDYKRLHRDMYIIEGLADLVIEKEIGIKSSFTQSREHLFELKGFREAFSEELIEKTKGTDEIEEGLFPVLPNISIRLRGKRKFELLENLNTHILGYGKGMVIVQCYSGEKRFNCLLYLNFAEERLQSNWFDDKNLFLYDDGTSKSVGYLVDFLEFQREYFGSGILEVWDYINNKLLGRCDAFLPVNCMVNVDFYRVRIEEAQLEKERRFQEEKKLSAHLGDL